MGLATSTQTPIDEALYVRIKNIAESDGGHGSFTESSVIDAMERDDRRDFGWPRAEDELKKVYAATLKKAGNDFPLHHIYHTCMSCKEGPIQGMIVFGDLTCTKDFLITRR